MVTVLADRGEPYGAAHASPVIAAEASYRSGVSWAAILAGAAAAAALSLILLVLGSGLGFAAVSPWAASGVGTAAFTLSTAAWIAATALIASGVGGYLAGRLRVKWTGTHTDEIYFRDTAHGFLAWAVATLATAAVLGSAVGSALSTGASTLAAATGAATAAAAGPALTASSRIAAGPRGDGDAMGGATAYYVDTLFRRDAAAGAPDAATAGAMQDRGSTAEVARIFATGLRGKALPPDDAHYVAQLVAQRTGLSAQDAEKRVTDTYARAQAKSREVETMAREAADQARKAAAWTSLWIFVSLLIGAFGATLAATFGGRQRDLQTAY